MQKAVKRPGSLRAWFKRHESEIKKALHEAPFTKRGTIKASVINKLIAHDNIIKHISKGKWGLIKKKLVLARTFKRYHK